MDVREDDARCRWRRTRGRPVAVRRDLADHVTRGLPCTLTPWNWLWWVTDVRSVLSVELLNPHPDGEVLRDVMPSARPGSERVHGDAVCSGLGDVDRRRGRRGRSGRGRRRVRLVCRTVKPETHVSALAEQDAEVARPGGDRVPGSPGSPAGVDVQRPARGVEEPGAGGGRRTAGRRPAAVRPATPGTVRRRRERVLSRRRCRSPSSRPTSDTSFEPRIRLPRGRARVIVRAPGLHRSRWAVTCSR